MGLVADGHSGKVASPRARCRATSAPPPFRMPDTDNRDSSGMNPSASNERQLRTHFANVLKALACCATLLVFSEFSALAQTLTAATGGSAISADTTGGT